MSDLSTANCGCGCEGRDRFGGDCGCGGCSCGCNNSGCGFGNNSCLWIILLLCCCGGFGNGCGNAQYNPCGKRYIFPSSASVRKSLIAPFNFSSYGIAEACHREGAELAFTYSDERFAERLKGFAAQFGSDIVLPMDNRE